MTEDQQVPTNLVDTTDALEAVGVVREWKNFLFVLLFACPLLIQAVFWLVNTGLVKTTDQPKTEQAVVSTEAVKPDTQLATATEEIKQVAQKVAEELLRRMGMRGQKNR